MKQKILALTMAAVLALSGAGNTGMTAQAQETQLSTTISPFTGETYTHASAFDNYNIYNGIDVSYHQGEIDFSKVKAAGVDFVFLRAGYRSYSSGSLQTDSKFEEYITDASAAGLKVGLYFYTEAVNSEEAKEEAEYCLNLAQNHDISLPIAYDIEFSNGSNSRMVKKGLNKGTVSTIKTLTENCKSFCDTIQAGGYTPMVYTSRSFLNAYIDGAALEKSYKIWMANYTKQIPTDYTGTYEFWQYSSNGTIDGISGRVDCNFWYTTGTLADLNAISVAKASTSSVKAKTYTGEAITPTPTVKVNGVKLTPGVDYRLVYSNNVEIGQATIKIKGIGKYKGTKKITFKIRPKKVKSVKKKAGDKQITLSWAQNSQATGYIIYRKGTYNSKTYKKVQKITKNTTLTWTDSGRKSDREYFYAIRAYTKKDDTKYYSNYVYLTARTLPGGKTATVNKKAKLYAAPDTTQTALVTVPKGTAVKYLGRTYIKGTDYVFHIKCTIDDKSYEGYLPAETKLTVS